MPLMSRDAHFHLREPSFHQDPHRAETAQAADMLGFLMAVCHIAGVTSWRSMTSCVLGTHGQASQRY